MQEGQNGGDNPIDAMKLQEAIESKDSVKYLEPCAQQKLH
jgi:hypothetical protein